MPKQILLNKSSFSVKESYIYYKQTRLWRTLSTSLQGYSFYLLDESAESNIVTLQCKDNHSDYYHFGNWDSIEEAQKWLALQ